MNDAATGCCGVTCAAIGREDLERTIEIHGKLCLLDEGNGLYTVEQLLGREFYVVIDGDTVILPCAGMRTDLGSIPRLVQLAVPKDRYNIGFIPHDACYYYRYVFRALSGVVGSLERRYLAEAAREENENERLALLGSLFELVPIKNRHICDEWLDRLIAHVGGLRSVFDRAIIRAGLFIGSWVPWYHGKYAKRLDELKRKPLHLNSICISTSL